MEVGCSVISYFTEARLIPKSHFSGKKSELHSQLHENYDIKTVFNYLTVILTAKKKILL